MNTRLLDVEFDDKEITVRLRRPAVRMMAEDTMPHLRAASREMLLAFRALIDSALARTERGGQGTGPRRRRIDVTPPADEKKE